jgi:hypothetical protein
VGTYIRYTSATLVDYFDTIVLYTELTAGKNPRFWLEMKNYADVFDPEASPDEVALVVRGAQEHGVKLVNLPESDRPEQKARLVRKRVGAELDAVDVIRFQQAVLKYHDAHNMTKATSSFGYSLSLLDAGFKSTESAQYLSSSPGLDAIAYKNFQALGFDAYFPKPTLILQEERTRLTATGRTNNEDLRKIDPIYLNSAKVFSQADLVPKSAFHDFWKILDKELTEQKERELNELVKQGNLKRKEFGQRLAEELKVTLHEQLEPIACYAFRGDDRQPKKIYDAEGFHSTTTLNLAKDGEFFAKKGVISKKEGWESFQITTAEEAAKAIDYGLKPGQDVALYVNIMKHLANVDNYTTDQNFKPYVSTTTSVGIAKCFANYWKKPPVGVETFCYAVRVRSGYRLPSTAGTLFDLKKLHGFANWAEQEVIVPCGIFWEDVVGWRLIRTTINGQFFSGPVFLRKELVSTDSKGFSALFEVLSGKGQGKSAEIENSYTPGDGYRFTQAGQNGGTTNGD